MRKREFNGYAKGSMCRRVDGEIRHPLPRCPINRPCYFRNRPAPYPTAISPGIDSITTQCEREDIHILDAGIECAPVCAVIGGTINATAMSSGKNGAAAHCKRENIHFGKVVIGGKENTVDTTPTRRSAVAHYNSVNYPYLADPGQAGIDLSPACTIICRKKNAATRSPGKEVAAARCKRMDIRIREAVIDRTPACTVIGGTKNAVVLSPGKDVTAANGKTHDSIIREAVIDLSPACTVICRKKNAFIRPGKDVAAAHGKRPNIKIHETGIDGSPACAAIGRKESTAGIGPGKDPAAAHCERRDSIISIAYIGEIIDRPACTVI